MCPNSCPCYLVAAAEPSSLAQGCVVFSRTWHLQLPWPGLEPGKRSCPVLQSGRPGVPVTEVAYLQCHSLTQQQGCDSTQKRAVVLVARLHEVCSPAAPLPPEVDGDPPRLLAPMESRAHAALASVLALLSHCCFATSSPKIQWKEPCRSSLLSAEPPVSLLSASHCAPFAFRPAVA